MLQAVQSRRLSLGMEPRPRQLRRAEYCSFADAESEKRTLQTVAAAAIAAVSRFFSASSHRAFLAMRVLILSAQALPAACALLCRHSARRFV